jgi:hypothetical protein
MGLTKPLVIQRLSERERYFVELLERSQLPLYRVMWSIWVIDYHFPVQWGFISREYKYYLQFEG